MKKEEVLLNIFVEGHAGQGPNAVAKIIGSMFVDMGYYVFLAREYGSFIRGGYNCNILSVSNRQVMSNGDKMDVVVSLDKNLLRTEKVKFSSGVIEFKSNGEGNMYFAGKLAKLFGIEIALLERELKKLGNYEKNIKDAKKGYDETKTKWSLKRLDSKLEFIDGANGVAKGAISSGLDVYCFYPMTPATSVVNYLAEKQREGNFFTIELEDEISVMNAAIGSAITGAKSMVGTSGGGFDLMTEALSLTGIAGVPLVVYLAQRPGPATGMATGTAQGDLNIARHAGHGEFSRIVLAPGDPVEAQELASDAFYFSQKYKIPCIILSDKHLAESIYSCSGKPNLVKSEKSTNFGRYNSYEHDKTGTANDSAELAKKNAETRLQKHKEIEKEAEKFEMFKTYGNKDSKNLILFWGSTKGAVLDAMRAGNINAKALQPLFMEPFSKKIKAELEKAGKIVIVENNATSQLSALIAEKTGIIIDDKNKILKYDGRPFSSDELVKELRERIK